MQALFERRQRGRTDTVQSHAEAETRQQAAARPDHRQMHLGAVARLQGGAHLAEPVDQSQFEATPAGPELAAEQQRVVALELAGTALAHPVLEAVMDLGLQAVEALDVLGLLRAEGVEHRLALARRMQAAFDAEARDQILKAEARADDPDRA